MFTRAVSGSLEGESAEAWERSRGAKGTTFDVPPSEMRSVLISEGTFDIYFLYADKPAAAFKGDSFTVDRSGVEMVLSLTEDGGYSIRTASSVVRIFLVCEYSSVPVVIADRILTLIGVGGLFTILHGRT